MGKKNREATTEIPRTRDSDEWEAIKVWGTDSGFAEAVFAAANLHLGRRRDVPMPEFLQAIEDAEWAFRRGTKTGGDE